MIESLKINSQFILLLIFMYVIGVWLDPLIYLIFPLIFGLYGLKRQFLEVFILTVWMLILSDYIPVRGATYADLQFAKDLKPILPLFLFGFYLINRDEFPKIPKVFIRFIPFFIAAIIGLQFSIKIGVGVQKTLSYLLMYFTIPLYVVYLHKTYGEFFWRTLITFIVLMLAIGIVIGITVPSIGILVGGRFKGVLGNPNGLGIFLNLTFMLWVLAQEFKLTFFSKRENLFILIVLFVSLFWCGSRNGLMSIFLFYLVYRTSKIHWSIAIVSVIFIVVFQDLIFAGFIELIQFFQLGDYFRVDSIEEGSGRKIAWVFAWQEIQKYFFIGGGFGHDEHIMRPNYKWLSMEGHQGGVHNSYLSLWFDSGLVGIITYFSGLLYHVFKSFNKSHIGLAVLASLLFNITYESWIVASLNPFTIIYLIILTIFVVDLNEGSQSLEVVDTLKIENDEIR